ncbi:HepT-like ribonuclease domain-containing protein [Flagellimonas marinaquae]
MSKRDNILLIQDMIESARKIMTYTRNMSFDRFKNDSKTVDAVIRNFEVIGEAANRLTDDFKTKNPEIEWSHLRGFRNRIVHEYFGIDLEIVWHIIEENLPELLAALRNKFPD